MDERLIWLWLSLHFGAGNTIYEKLYSYFGSVEAIFDCDDYDVEPIDWLTASQKRKLLDKNTAHAKEVEEWCYDNNTQIIAFSDSEYPEPLKSLFNFPAVLYCKGIMPNFKNELCIAVVGTRNMTVYGQKTAYEIGFGLAKGGAVVVSGMALGIDVTAQKGALYAGGKTVAVLGSGIDVVYPRINAPVMQKIISTGAVITEYPPHTPPIGSNFPVRNRIISGLCLGTVVVEADLNSGAMITARTTLNQGRELFSVPGPIHTFTSTGTNQLIRDGAHVATSAVDIIEQYLDLYPDKISISGAKMRPVFDRTVKVASNFNNENFYASYGKKKNDSANNEPISFKSSRRAENTNSDTKSEFDTSTLSESERKLYDFMEYERPVIIDDMKIPGMSIAEISATVTMLEIAGAIEAKPGGYYIKK